MTRMNQADLLKHIQTLMCAPRFEVAGETWRHDSECGEWIRQEPFSRRCPHCDQDTMVNVRDSSACFDSTLIADPENHSLGVDYSNAETELYDPGFYCSECGRKLDLQATCDFEEEYKLRKSEAAQ